MKKKRIFLKSDLVETNIVGVLLEASTADHHTVFSDNTMGAGADTA